MRQTLSLPSVLVLAVALTACEEAPPTTADPPISARVPGGAAAGKADGIAPPQGAEATAMPLSPFSFTAAPGAVASLDLTLVVARLDADYAVFVHVGNETTLTESEIIPQPGTSTWSGRTVLTVPVRLPTTSGTYEIRAGLYSGDERLILEGGTPQVRDDDASVRYTVGTVTVAGGKTTFGDTNP